MCSQLVQFTLVRKGYDNHHCHNKPQTENGAEVWMTSCPPPKNELRIWKILKKIQLRSHHGVEKLGFDHSVEKLRSDHSVEKLRFDHGVEIRPWC